MKWTTIPLWAYLMLGYHPDDGPVNPKGTAYMANKSGLRIFAAIVAVAFLMGTVLPAETIWGGASQKIVLSTGAALANVSVVLQDSDYHEYCGYHSGDDGVLLNVYPSESTVSVPCEGSPVSYKYVNSGYSCEFSADTTQVVVCNGSKTVFAATYVAAYAVDINGTYLTLAASTMDMPSDSAEYIASILISGNTLPPFSHEASQCEQ